MMLFSFIYYKNLITYSYFSNQLQNAIRAAIRRQWRNLDMTIEE